MARVEAIEALDIVDIEVAGNSSTCRVDYLYCPRPHMLDTSPQYITNPTILRVLKFMRSVYPSPQSINKKLSSSDIGSLNQQF